MFTPGDWRSGPNGSVVSEQVVDDPMRSHTICTGLTPGNQALVRCAPDMYDFIVAAKRMFPNESEMWLRAARLIARASGIGA